MRLDGDALAILTKTVKQTLPGSLFVRPKLAIVELLPVEMWSE